jgi:glycosyltransferase involved in cell wall biosynthesis
VKGAPDLYLVGEKPSASAQELLAELHIADRVRLLGVLSDDELPEIYGNALFFVLSSDEEGLGIVNLEAMASGLPVVSTDCGGPATSIVDGETGFLTPVGDAGALAERMQRLLEDPTLCQRMGRAGRQVVEERFSLAAAGRVFLDAYDEILRHEESSDVWHRGHVCL